MIKKRHEVILSLYGIFLLTSAIACFCYPDDRVLPLAIASLFGPFMGFMLGFADSAMALLIVLGLILPFAWRSNFLTIVLLLLGIAIWGFAGYGAGLWLYA